jgi:MFS family permease
MTPSDKHATSDPGAATKERHAVAVAFAAIVVAMLPAVLDQTILATTLPTIAGDLGRLTDVSWVVSAYVIAAAATTPLWGKLGDRHGRKHLLEVSLILFLAASAVCGAAQSIAWLIVSRAVRRPRSTAQGRRSTPPARSSWPARRRR